MNANQFSIKNFLLLIVCSTFFYSGEVIADKKKENLVSMQEGQVSKESVLSALIGKIQDLPEGLLPSTAIAKGVVKNRGITFDKEMPTTSSEQQTPQITTSGCQGNEGTTLAVNITFALNSAYLEPSAFSALSQIAAAMNDAQLSGCAFIVEGHTDASGDEAYNQRLSQKRAEVVARFLQAVNVPNSKLSVIGKGESELIDVEMPQSEKNRRVQFKIHQFQG